MKMANMCAAVGGMAAAILLAFGAGGCFTVSETPYPETAMLGVGPAVTNRSVQLRGFEATLVDCIPVDGYVTAYDNWGWSQMAHTRTYVAQARPTAAFAERARDRFEQAGFNLGAPTPDFIVEVRFEGPFHPDGAAAWRALWFVGTILTCDRDEMFCRAKLRVYDNHTGRLAFSRDYDQTHQATGFSPIPLFGPMSYGHTEYNYVASWCYSALVDRITADASAFLVNCP